MNDEYYFDIKHFPKQFAEGFELAKDIKVDGNFNRVIVCGMGGSSFYTALMNDYLACDGSIKLKLETVKTYDIPKNSDSQTLFLISSYSGNTEEPINCLDQIDARGYSYIILSSGGELEQRALARNCAFYKIPGGTQPRLSTGYFIAGIFQILMNMGLLPDKKAELIAAANSIESSLDEQRTKDLAQAMKDKVPVIYSADFNSSLAQITKIKLNENSKIQSFWNYFPEFNHNEMVGYTKLIMNPYFLIFSSQFQHPRINKRMEIFKKLMEEKGAPVTIIDLKGTNVIEEILMGYYMADHISYYLAAAYGVDPEPVTMVEDFKHML